jgi:Sulfotransferase family
VSTILVHIGYHKAASTWLQRELFVDRAGYRWLGKRPASHPVRRFVRERPFEFDAADLRRAFDPLIADAEGAGVVPVVSFERLSGHPFSGGFDVDLIGERLAQVFPDARVLIVVREQRAMIVSTYKQYVQVGGASPVQHFLEPRVGRSLRIPWFDARYFEYDHLVRYYCRLFGKERVLALPYELFARDGRSFVERVAELGGRPIPDDVLSTLRYRRRSNRARSALTIGAVRRLNRFTDHTELNPAPLAEWRAAARLSDWLQRTEALDNRLTNGLEARSQSGLRRAVEEWAGDRYAESNRRLADLIGIDLAAHGWTVAPSR